MGCALRRSCIFSSRLFSNFYLLVLRLVCCSCQLVLFAILLLVFPLEVEFICLFASFNYMSNNYNANEEAGRTSTCEVLLSVRSTALKPDQSTRQRIVLLGCVGRRRGCREGRAKKKHKHFSDTGRKFLLSLRVTTSYIRPYTEILARFVVQSYVR